MKKPFDVALSRQSTGLYLFFERGTPGTATTPYFLGGSRATVVLGKASPLLEDEGLDALLKRPAILPPRPPPPVSRAWAGLGLGAVSDASSDFSGGVGGVGVEDARASTTRRSEHAHPPEHPPQPPELAVGEVEAARAATTLLSEHRHPPEHPPEQPPELAVGGVEAARATTTRLSEHRQLPEQPPEQPPELAVGEAVGGLETALAVEVVQVMRTRFERTPPRQHLVPLRAGAPGRRVTAVAKVIPLRLAVVVAVVVIACASRREVRVDRFERPIGVRSWLFPSRNRCLMGASHNATCHATWRTREGLLPPFYL